MFKANKIIAEKAALIRIAFGTSKKVAPKQWSFCALDDLMPILIQLATYANH
ncbi:hypothetical protein ACFL1V_09520 [Pseudomonadota bacterium]